MENMRNQKTDSGFLTIKRKGLQVTKNQSYSDIFKPNIVDSQNDQLRKEQKEMDWAFKKQPLGSPKNLPKYVKPFNEYIPSGRTERSNTLYQSNDMNKYLPQTYKPLVSNSSNNPSQSTSPYSYKPYVYKTNSKLQNLTASTANKVEPPKSLRSSNVTLNSDSKKDLYNPEINPMRSSMYIMREDVTQRNEVNRNQKYQSTKNIRYEPLTSRCDFSKNNKLMFNDQFDLKKQNYWLKSQNTKIQEQLKQTSQKLKYAIQNQDCLRQKMIQSQNKIKILEQRLKQQDKKNNQSKSRHYQPSDITNIMKKQHQRLKLQIKEQSNKIKQQYTTIVKLQNKLKLQDKVTSDRKEQFGKICNEKKEVQTKFEKQLNKVSQLQSQLKYQESLLQANKQKSDQLLRQKQGELQNMVRQRTRISAQFHDKLMCKQRQFTAHKRQVELSQWKKQAELQIIINQKSRMVEQLQYERTCKQKQFYDTKQQIDPSYKLQMNQISKKLNDTLQRTNEQMSLKKRQIQRLELNLRHLQNQYRQLNNSYEIQKHFNEYDMKVRFAKDIQQYERQIAELTTELQRTRKGKQSFVQQMQKKFVQYMETR